FATSFLLNFQEGSSHAYVEKMKESINCKWNPPAAGWYKVSFDGAQREDRRTGIDIVIRDEYEQLVASYVEHMEWSANSEITEALGGYRALEIAYLLGLKKI
ncbi:hypothetical protein U1Q18_041636, partial [Sarracenia purpurea var. burkii]